jgi:DNA repair exonuclease SbcCD nuclease subunit
MERIKLIKKPDLIITSDWHLREDTPICWIGDFQMEQWLSVAFVSKLQEKYNCPVVHAGDLFHHWKPSPWLLAQAIDHLPQQFYTIYGQHDLPQHNLELRGKSGINCLKVADRLNILGGWHYGQTPDKGEGGMLAPYGRIICVWHHMTYTNPPYPGTTGGNALMTLKKYPQFSLICTGDNHQSFHQYVDEKQSRVLVNPGSLTRQTADQIDFQPRVALWYADTNEIKWVAIPIQKDAITREHLTVKEERNERIDAFIESLNKDYDTELSFEKNLKNFCEVNKTNETVKHLIFKSIE